MSGVEFKEDMKKLDAYYSNLPEEIKKEGLHSFADVPPDDMGFLTTRLWDQYLPRWRVLKNKVKKPRDPQEDARILAMVKSLSQSDQLVHHNETDPDKLQYAAISRGIRLIKGKWSRFSQEKSQRIRENSAKNPGPLF